jgi:hypothetical protein
MIIKLDSYIQCENMGDNQEFLAQHGDNRICTQMYLPTSVLTDRIQATQIYR